MLSSCSRLETRQQRQQHFGVLTINPQDPTDFRSSHEASQAQRSALPFDSPSTASLVLASSFYPVVLSVLDLYSCVASAHSRLIGEQRIRRSQPSLEKLRTIILAYLTTTLTREDHFRD